MSNYWIRENGQNTLKGVTGDFENPPFATRSFDSGIPV